MSNTTAILLLTKHLSRKFSSLNTHHASSVSPKLPKETVAKLEEQAEAAFKTSLDQASLHFNNEIEKTSQTLNQLIVRLTTSVVEEELVEYRKSLAEARTVALQSLSTMQKEIKQQQAVLEADMQEAIKNRQTALVETLEQNIGVIATNYIVEALGQGVDLGAQREYLLSSLERNKNILKKDILAEL